MGIGFSARLLAAATMVGGAVALAPATASATPGDYGNGCALYPHNSAASVDSLRFRCSPQQLETIFRHSTAGHVPLGVRNGWVTHPPVLPVVAPAFWQGKTFNTGAHGGSLTNRTLVGDAFLANVYRAPSRMDGKPMWALDYEPSIKPVWDEIREVSPGVWFGYSYWRGILQTPMLLGFILA